MLKCLQCGARFYEPIKCSEIIPEDITQVERWDGCPRCKSDEWVAIYHCQICGEEISDGGYKCLDGSVYCKKCCSYFEE